MEAQVFEEGALPPAFEWQALAAVRMHWPGAFSGEGAMPSRLRDEHEPDHDLVAHAVVAAGEVLASYASILATTIRCAGERYAVLGLSNVFAFPSLRGRGLGRLAVAAAERWMEARAGADLALLFSTPGVEPFYARHGWEAASGATMIGPEDDEAPHPRPSPPMMRLISPRARAARADLLSAPLSVGAKRW